MSTADEVQSDWVDETINQWEASILSCDLDGMPEHVKNLFQEKQNQLALIDSSNLSGWRYEWSEWLKNLNEQSFSNDDEPDLEQEWVQKVMKSSVEAFMPALSLNALMQNRPYFSKARILGELVGHEFALWHTDSPGLMASCEKMPAGCREFFVFIVEAWREPRLAAVRQVIATASQQSLKDATLFFRGFTLAAQAGSMSESGRPINDTSATSVYNILLFFSDFVKHLRSVREVHEWLQYMLGANLVGNEERVEKICQRINLRLTSPGRPSQS